MEIKPIVNFENDYYITSEGNVIDAKTNKVKLTYCRNNYKYRYVDLYKDGRLTISMKIIDIVLYHFFGGFKYLCNVTYKDDDETNCNVNNIIINTSSKYYVTKRIKKDSPIYLKEKERKYRERLQAKRKLPQKGTSEYNIWQHKIVENRYIHHQIAACKYQAKKHNLPIKLTVKLIRKILEEQNYQCKFTGESIGLTSKDSNALRLFCNDNIKGFVDGNISIISKKIYKNFFTKKHHPKV